MENVLKNIAMKHSLNLITNLHCKIKSRGVKLKQGRKNCCLEGFPKILKPISIYSKPLEKESYSIVYPIYSTPEEDKLHPC